MDSKRASAPAGETFREAAYLKSLGETKKSVTLKLQNGEVLQGWIEYYDRDMIRLTRDSQPNLFIFKHDIMYIAEDAATK